MQTKTPGIKLTSKQKDLLMLLAVTVAARVAFLIVMPARAVSLDLFSWVKVAKILAEGGNPYNLTSVLNWPPLWMQIVFGLSRLSMHLHLPFFRCVQGFLILVDAGIVAVLYSMIHSFFPGLRARRTVLWAISLNPIIILLTCQHSTSDGLMVLWILLFMWMLLDWEKREDVVSWLYACFFLGLGVLTKTVPLALAPLLAYRFSRLRLGARLLGGALLAGPSALGLSILYALGPQDIAAKVLGYRSVQSWFGVTGLMQIMHRPSWAPVYAGFFTAVFLGLLIYLFWRLSTLAEAPARCLILLAVALLIAIPALGPGYSPTYAYSFLPLLAVSWKLFDHLWKSLAAVFFSLALVTYLIEYALLPSHGFFLLLLTGMPDRLMLLSSALSGQEAQTLLRLPLFLAYLAVLVKAAQLARKELNSRTGREGAPRLRGSFN